MYWISSFGKAFSERTGILAQTYSFDYLYVMLHTIDARYKRVRMHRLVMLGFNYFQGCENYEVNHKDGVKSHNWIWNLEWSTRKENMDHAVNEGLAVSCENSYRATITNEQAIQICELLSTGEYLCDEIADLVGCSLCVVHGIAGRNSWTMISKNYVFKKKVSKAFTNDQLRYIANFIINNQSKYSTENSMFRDILINLGLYNGERSLNSRRSFMHSIKINPYHYLEKLNNCIY